MNYPYFNKQSINIVKNVLKSGKVNYWTGKEGIHFEKEFSKYIGNKYSITVSNGSVALEISLKALNLKKGDKVIVTPRSFIASANCVINLGLIPVFSDVDDNGNLSISGIRKAYDKSVKAIIVVHLNGMPCDLKPIIEFKKNNNLLLVEDCSQAHGSRYKGKSVGSFGDLAIWSFCQDKIISTGGEGGMISTNNKSTWKKCWSLKDHGKNYHSVFYKKHKEGFRWLHDYHGSNYRMTEMQSALGRYQLKNLDEYIKKRNKIAYLYLDGLQDFWNKYKILKKPNYTCSDCPIKKNCDLCKHAFYRLDLFVNKKVINQIKFIEQLNKNDISCLVGSCPEIYREKIFKKLYFYPKKRLSNAKLLGETSVMFRINPNKSLSLIKREINVIKKILNSYTKS